MPQVGEDGLTFGVEEEFLLVDKTTGRVRPSASAVLARVREQRWRSCDVTVQPELMTTQLEVASGVCTSVVSLSDQLLAARQHLATAAQQVGVRLITTGAPPLGAAKHMISPGDRFARIAGAYAGLIDDYHACGCHVHVGVRDKEHAVAVLNVLRPWLPTLLALSVNSPLAHGRDTGYASWRIVHQSRFPAAGLPPFCSSAADYDERVAHLVERGAVLDPAMSFWLARVSPRLPTVELRVADVALTAGEAVLQAALSRALVRTALAELARGRSQPWMDEKVGAAAMWAAVRHGARGPGVHPATGRHVPAAVLVQELLDYVRPALEEAGDFPFVRSVLSAVLADGVGAERQRRAARQGPDGLIDMLSSQAVSTALTPTDCRVR